MGETRGQLDFALEATEVDLAGPIGPQQLDRRGPPHHAVAGAVDLAHSAFADLLFEHVLAEPARFADLGPQAVDDPRDDGARDDREAPHHRSGGRQPGIGAPSRARARRARHRRPARGARDTGSSGAPNMAVTMTVRRGDEGIRAARMASIIADAAELQHRHVAVGHQRRPRRSRANDRGRTRPGGSAPASAPMVELSSRPPLSITPREPDGPLPAPAQPPEDAGIGRSKPA